MKLCAFSISSSALFSDTLISHGTVSRRINLTHRPSRPLFLSFSFISVGNSTFFFLGANAHTAICLCAYVHRNIKSAAASFMVFEATTGLRLASRVLEFQSIPEVTVVIPYIGRTTCIRDLSRITRKRRHFV